MALDDDSFRTAQWCIWWIPWVPILIDNMDMRPPCLKINSEP